MTNVKDIGTTSEPSIRELAEREVRKEMTDKAIKKMKDLLRQKADAETVVRGFDMQIKDLEQQIADGTL